MKKLSFVFHFTLDSEDNNKVHRVIIESENEKFLSTAKITWADYSKSHAQSQMAYAVSDTSEEESFKKLLSKIEQKDFFV